MPEDQESISQDKEKETPAPRSGDEEEELVKVEEPSQEDPEQEESKKGKGPPDPSFENSETKKGAPFLSKRLLMGAVVVGGLLALVLGYGPRRLWTKIEDLKGHDSSMGGLEDRLEKKESLRPFYIPMPAGSDPLMVKVEISVRWDRFTSARYKREAPRIRDRIYGKLLELSAKGVGDEAQGSKWDAELEAIMKRMLGVKDIELHILEIKNT